MIAYPFIAGMAFLLGCFAINEVQLSHLETRESEEDIDNTDVRL